MWNNALLQLAMQVASLGLLLSGALVMYKSCMLITNSESPIVVVLRYVLLSLDGPWLCLCSERDGGRLLQALVAIGFTRRWTCLLDVSHVWGASWALTRRVFIGDTF